MVLQDLTKADQVWDLSEQLVGLESGVSKQPAMA